MNVDAQPLCIYNKYIIDKIILLENKGEIRNK